MKRKCIIGAFAAILSLGFSSFAQAEKKAAAESKAVNSECPMSGKAIGSASLDVDVGFCCNSCKKKFTKNPGKYLAKAAAAGDACPMSGKAVKVKAPVKVGFCCGNCKGKFAKDAQKNLAKVKPAG